MRAFQSPMTCDFPTTNLCHVAKNGDDSYGKGTLRKPFLSMQAAITYAKTNYTINDNNHCQIRVAPGLYSESITDSNDHIYIINANLNPNDRSKDVIIYNTGADAAHYPLAYTGRINLAGISVKTNVGGVFGKIAHDSQFQYCYFEGGHFIESLAANGIYMDFRFCTFENSDAFKIEGTSPNWRFIALRFCDIFGTGSLIFSSTQGTIKFQNTMCANAVLVSGSWGLLCQDTELYGTNGKFTFDTDTGSIFVYNSILPNGMHFNKDTTGTKTINDNTFRGGGSNILPGVADITADASITIVNYTGNEQYNGLCSNFQIAGPDRCVGGFAPDRYIDLQCAVSSIPTAGTIYLHESYTNLAKLIMPSESDIIIDGDRTYSLEFIGDIVDIGLNQKAHFHRLTNVAGGKIEINGNGAMIGFQSCHNVETNIVATGGVGSYAVSFNSTFYGSTGNPVLEINNVDTTFFIGYSFMKGAAGQPAVHFTADADNKFKAKYSIFLHGDGGVNSPISRTGVFTVILSTYNCAGNDDLSPAGITNNIGGANNTTDAQLDF